MGFARGTYRYTPLFEHPGALWRCCQLKQLLKDSRIWHLDCSLYDASPALVETQMANSDGYSVSTELVGSQVGATRLFVLPTHPAGWRGTAAASPLTLHEGKQL